MPQGEYIELARKRCVRGGRARDRACVFSGPRVSEACDAAWRRAVGAAACAPRAGAGGTVGRIGRRAQRAARLLVVSLLTMRACLRRPRSYGYRMDHFEKQRKKEARAPKKQSAMAQKVRVF